jgi:hypothetical protein
LTECLAQTALLDFAGVVLIRQELLGYQTGVAQTPGQSFITNLVMAGLIADQ